MSIEKVSSANDLAPNFDVSCKEVSLVPSLGRLLARNGLVISRAHSSISDGDITILLDTLINFNLCCIQQFESHVYRW